MAPRARCRSRVSCTTARTSRAAEALRGAGFADGAGFAPLGAFPFADESLVTLLTREATGRRISTSCKRKPLDRTIYQYGSCYYGVIYVQGGDYLAAYRNRVGRAAFWRGVSDYYERYSFAIGGTRELLDALDAAANGAGGGHAGRFPRLYGVE